MTARPARALLLAALSSLAALPARADEATTNTVMLTIFGKLGEQPKEDKNKDDPGVTWPQCSLAECPDAPKKAGQWTLSTIMRSMLKHFTKDDSLGDMPDIQLQVVPPFHKNLLMTKKDQTSPFSRAVIRFRFKNMVLESAARAAEDLCRDYESEEEELVKGISRAFAAVGMRPWEALGMASSMSLKLNSFIHLSSSVDGPGGEPIAGYGCNWDTQPLAGTSQGMFFLPRCPSNAATEETSGHVPRCKCNIGYHGTIDYVQKKNIFEGDCALVEDFCHGDYDMVREDGSPAKGTLDESARAKCPKGEKSTGMAKCVVSGGHGEWSPSKLCRKEIPPKCVHDFLSPSARNIQTSEGCDSCNIFQHAPVTDGESGPEVCNCEVKCAADTERYGGGLEGPRSCSEEDPNLEKPPLCLPKRTCRKSGPVPTISETSCAAESSQEKCLLGKEKVGGEEVPCCWLGDSCAAKGSSSIPWNQPPQDCALLVPEDMEICEETCPNIYKDLPNVEQKGCDECTNALGKDCPCEVNCKEPAKALVGKDSKGVEYPPQGSKECVVVAGMVQFEEPPFCSIPCKAPDTAAGTLDVSQCTPPRRPDGTDCFPGVADCQCVVKCPEGFMAVGGGADGDSFQCNEAGVFDGLPVCRPVCDQPGDQHGQLDTGACSSCIAGAEDCSCKLSCKHRHVGGGPEGQFTCVMTPGDEEQPARAIWAVKDVAEREALGDKAFQLPACLEPITISIVSATTKEPMKDVTIEVEVNGRVIAAPKTDENGVVELDMVAGEEIYVIASLPGYSKIRRKFQRDVNCKDPKENCGTQLSMSETLKFGSLSANGCYFTASDKTREWEMRAVLEWGEEPKDLDIWARNLGCFKDVAKRYNCLNGDKSTCERYKFAEREVEKVEEQSCAAKYCRRAGRGSTAFKDGKPECGVKERFKGKTNQFPKWILWSQRYTGLMHKRIEGEKAVPIKASTLKIVSIAGFKRDRYCDGRSCDVLNGEYLQRPGFGDTYWKGGEFFLYPCQKAGEAAWVIAAAPPLEGQRDYLEALRNAGECHGLARTSPGADILDAAKVPFPEIWEGEQVGWKSHSGAAVVRLHLPEAGKDLDWTDDHYMCLDVDHTEGKGPETVTFRNAPPGLYQIIVSIWGGGKDIRKGNPVVSLYVGASEGALFECEIPPDCTNSSAVWNVVNIEVIDGGAELDGHGKPTGKSRYYMRLATTPETLEPVHELELPTARPRDKPLDPEATAYKAKAANANYFKMHKHWSDTYLKTVCHGHCKPAAGYEQCLKPQPMPPPPKAAAQLFA